MTVAGPARDGSSEALRQKSPTTAARRPGLRRGWGDVTQVPAIRGTLTTGESHLWYQRAHDGVAHGKFSAWDLTEQFHRSYVSADCAQAGRIGDR